MPVNLEFEFSYDDILPFLPITALADSGLQRTFYALLDTGADMTILDERIAQRLGLDLTDADEVSIAGVGGGGVVGRIREVDLIPLGEPDLLVRIEVAFVTGIGERIGNLIGRDVLEYLDFGLAHSTRMGYLGRTETLA